MTYNTIMVWNDGCLYVRHIKAEDSVIDDVVGHLRAKLHGPDSDDSRWQVVPFYLTLDIMMLDDKGNRSIFDDVDK